MNIICLQKVEYMKAKPSGS